jgi:predicted ATPase
VPRYFFTIRGRDRIKDDHYGTNLPDVAAAPSIAESKRALAAFIGQGNRLFVPFYQGLLAEIEAERQDTEVALTRINEVLTLVSETGEHWTDALLQRIRGDILLKCEPANTASAEEAFLTAIAIAQMLREHWKSLGRLPSSSNFDDRLEDTIQWHSQSAPARASWQRLRMILARGV